MDGRGTAFQCDGCGVESRRGAADHRHGLACQRGEFDGMAGVRCQACAHRSRQQFGYEDRTAAGHAVGKDQLARGFHALDAVDLQMNPEMRHRPADDRLEPQQLRAVANGDARDAAEPVEVFSPSRARNAIDGGIGFEPMPRFEPGLEAQRRDRPFGTDQVLERAQLLHARPREPDADRRAFGGRVDHADRADSCALQREGEGTAGLAGTDDQHVVIDAGMGGHPVGWRRAEKAQRFMGEAVRVG